MNEAEYRKRLGTALSRVRYIDGVPWIAARDRAIIATAAARSRARRAQIEAPATEPPVFIIELPEQPAPVVNVSPTPVTVETAPPADPLQPRSARVVRGEDGRITGVEYETRG